ncbi:hypothetical protein CSB69_3634 [Morganella morganii]|nr:hypothetical protein CSB69_3634 [Morganella morganii]EMP52581.1 hypothetical protein C790_03554 [Morganella morganii SC01]
MTYILNFSSVIIYPLKYHPVNYRLRGVLNEAEPDVIK